jgi:hypothetical protein
MKRALQFAIIVVLLASCGAPAAAPVPTWTNEAPKKVDVIIDVPTATDAPTFTPIPATFTLEPTVTATQTLTPTLKATNTIAVTATKIKATITRIVTRSPTKAPVPTRVIIPTNPPIVIEPTNPPVVIEPTDPPAQVCCKVCSAGKACGDSCISKDKTCNKPPGCACNG